MVFSLLLLTACENGTGNVTQEPVLNDEKELYDELMHDGENVRIYYFWSRTCPFCTRYASPFLDEMEQEYDVEVLSFELGDSRSRELFREVAQSYGKNVGGVPHIFLGSQDWVGFDGTGRIAGQIESKIVGCLENGCEDPFVR